MSRPLSHRLTERETESQEDSAVLFATLPWIAWQGAWAPVLAGVFVAEIVLTLTDFVVELPFGNRWETCMPTNG